MKKASKMKNIIQPLVSTYRTLVDLGMMKKYQKEYSKIQVIKALRECNKDNRCFIIGNGPSLSLSDLELLKNEDCFACNRIYGLLDKIEWRPKYYCVQDYKVLEKIANKLNTNILDSEIFFFPYNYRHILPEELIRDERTVLFYHRYKSVYSRNGTYPEGLMPFSEDMVYGLYDGLSVTYAMIQIAVYMGYKEIYLLGIDHNYTMKNGIVDASSSYCSGIDPIDMSTQFPPELTLCEVSFREARRVSEKRGIIIKNATRGGKLEVFDRIDLESVLACKR